MSAPQTDIEKQKRRHKGPLVGIALAVAFGAAMFILLLYSQLDAADEVPAGADAQGAATTYDG